MYMQTCGMINHIMGSYNLVNDTIVFIFLYKIINRMQKILIQIIGM